MFDMYESLDPIFLQKQKQRASFPHSWFYVVRELLSHIEVCTELGAKATSESKVCQKLLLEILSRKGTLDEQMAE